MTVKDLVEVKATQHPTTFPYLGLIALLGTQNSDPGEASHESPCCGRRATLSWGGCDVDTTSVASHGEVMTVLWSGDDRGVKEKGGVFFCNY